MLGLLQAVDELAVAQAALADGGVDADDPQLAELALADAAIAKGVDAGANQRFLGGAEQAAAAAAIAFDLLEQPPLGFGARGALDGTHDKSLTRLSHVQAPAVCGRRCIARMRPVCWPGRAWPAADTFASYRRRSRNSSAERCKIFNTSSCFRPRP